MFIKPIIKHGINKVFTVVIDRFSKGSMWTFREAIVIIVLNSLYISKVKTALKAFGSMVAVFATLVARDTSVSLFTFLFR